MFISDKIFCKKSILCEDKGVFAKKDIRTEERILEFIGKIKIGIGNEYTLQIDDNKHLCKSGCIDDFVNHSCDRFTL